MHTTTVIALICITALTALSVTRILRLPLRPWHRGTLLALRGTLALLLAVMFVEPVMVFERLPPKAGPVAVLVDNSKSMTLFAPDSSIVPVLAAIEAWNAVTPDKKQRFVFFRFGDSLRAASARLGRHSWADGHSLLPESFTDKTLRRAASLFLISDGNWSNASLPRSAYEDKRTVYLPLAKKRDEPYLQIEIAAFPAAAPQDSSPSVPITLEGVAGTGDSVTVSLGEKKQTLALRRFTVPKGRFSLKTALPLTGLAPGRHLIRCTARLSRGQTSTSRSLVHTVLPKRFIYAIAATRTTLDRRFLSLAIKRHSEFLEAAPESTGPLDLLVAFDWDESVRKTAARLKPKGTVLFMGVLPCSTATLAAPPGARLVRPAITVSLDPFASIDLGALPPPQTLVIPVSGCPRPRDLFLASVAPTSAAARPDTTRIIYTGRLDGRTFVACAARETWAWDFRPLAVEADESRAFGFSERLIALVRDVCINSQSEELCIYPATPLRENDSLSFWMMFPADLPLPSDVRCEYAFTDSAGKRANAAAVTVHAEGGLRQTLRLPPLPAGTYTFSCTALASGRRYAFADSIVVDRDRSEFIVSGQNTALLQELGEPFNGPPSAQSLRAAFFNEKAGPGQPIRQTVHFNRDWWLLVLLIVVFSAEWILRRMWRLD